MKGAGEAVLEGPGVGKLRVSAAEERAAGSTGRWARAGGPTGSPTGSPARRERGGVAGEERAAACDTRPLDDGRHEGPLPCRGRRVEGEGEAGGAELGVEGRPRGERLSERIAAGDALAELGLGELLRPGDRPEGELEGPERLHPAGIELEAAGEGGGLGGGGGEADEPGIGEGGAWRGNDRAEALDHPAGRGEGLFGGKPVGGLAEADGVVGKLRIGEGEHRVGFAAERKPGVGKRPLRLEGNADDAEGRAPGDLRRKLAAAGGKERVGKLDGRRHAPLKLHDIQKLATDGRDRRLLEPRGEDLADELADPGAGDRRLGGHGCLRRPTVGKRPLAAEDALEHPPRPVPCARPNGATGPTSPAAGAAAEEPIGEAVDRERGRIDRRLVDGRVGAGIGAAGLWLGGGRFGLGEVGAGGEEPVAEDAEGGGDLPARLRADAAHPLEPGPVGGEEIADGEDVGPVEGVGGPGAEAKGGDRRLKRSCGEEPGELLVALDIGGDRRGAEAREAGLPFGEHLLGVVEAEGDVAAEGAREEAGKRRAEIGVEEIGVDRRLGVDERRIAAAVPPLRQAPRSHLVERGGDGVALGVAVKPGRRAAEGEERIEVADGAGADVFLRHRGEGEIEEDDLEGVIAAHPADGDVVGLDVAVGDPLLLEVADDVDEVFAEALEELDVEAALLADPAGEGLDPLVVGVGEDWPHEEAGMVADRHLLHEGHDPRVAVLRQGAKRGRFGAEPLGMLGKESDFEDQLLAGGVAPREGAGDEERR